MNAAGPGPHAPVVVVWAQLGPTHHDRLAALAARLDGARVLAVEFAPISRRYPWPPSPAGEGYAVRTLFPDRCLEEVGEAARTRALLRLLRRERPRAVLLCNYDRPHVLIAAWVLAVAGTPVMLMADAKADDRPRRAWRERLKRLALRPFAGALAAGPRSRAYLEGLGLPAARMREGYDTLSVARLRRLSANALRPARHGDRPVAVVARCVPEKNLETALAAYARYRALCREAGLAPHGLVLAGDGPLRARLEASAPPGVRFAGFLPPAGVAAVLAGALALLLTSTREPWGLVVNEAVALGVPVLASARAGATDLLVRDGASGRVLEPDDTEGFAQALLTLSRDPDAWRRMAVASAAHAEAADAARFADAGAELLEACA